MYILQKRIFLFLTRNDIVFITMTRGLLAASQREGLSCGKASKGDDIEKQHEMQSAIR